MASIWPPRIISSFQHFLPMKFNLFLAVHFLPLKINFFGSFFTKNNLFLMFFATKNHTISSSVPPLLNYCHL
jgi:hypothetical protein